MARDRLLRGELSAERAGGIDLHAAGAVDAAQEAVVGRLDAGLADAIVQVHALVLGLLELLGGHLADPADHLRGQVVMGVEAQVDGVHGDAREVGLALADVGVDVLADVALHGRVGERQRPQLRTHRGADLRLVHLEHGCQALVEGRLHGLRLRQLVRADRDRVAGAVVHQHVAVAVHDLAPRGLDQDVPNLVVAGLGEVVVTRQDLQVPEPEEDDGEQNQCDAAEYRHPQRELRRDGGAVFVVAVQAVPLRSPGRAGRSGRTRWAGACDAGDPSGRPSAPAA